MTNKEFKVGCTYSDKRGNKWKITGNDNVGCFPLLAKQIYTKSFDGGQWMCDEFTAKGGYQEDEPSDFDLVYQEESDWALLEFKRKCKDFGVIAGKSSVPSEDDLRNQVKLCVSEVNELQVAVDEEPLINVLQECIDGLVTHLGLLEMFRELKYDVDCALLAVADCNLSKFTQDRQVAWESMEDYHSKNIAVTVDYNDEHNVYVLKDKNNKVRKPLDFKKVNLEEFKPK